MNIKSIDGLEKLISLKRWKDIYSPLCGIINDIGQLNTTKESSAFTLFATMSKVNAVSYVSRPYEKNKICISSGYNESEASQRLFSKIFSWYASNMMKTTAFRRELFASYDQIAKREQEMINRNQLKTHGLNCFDYSSPLTWLQCPSLTSKKNVWVPAQLLLTNYQLNYQLDEQEINMKLASGLSSSDDIWDALYDAFFELLMYDTAIGCWYSDYIAPRIKLDERTENINKLFSRHGSIVDKDFSFYLLSNIDLPGFVVVCLFKSGTIGLSAGIRLVPTLYQSYISAMNQYHLERLQKRTPDKNVNISKKFKADNVVKASDLAADNRQNKKRYCLQLIEYFRKTKQEVLCVDMTTVEAQLFGTHVVKIFSSDLLYLCEPHLPPLSHPRLIKYGIDPQWKPHPYSSVI